MAKQKKKLFGGMFKKDDEDIDTLRQELGLVEKSSRTKKKPSKSDKKKKEDSDEKAGAFAEFAESDDAPLPPKELSVKHHSKFTSEPDSSADIEGQLDSLKKLAPEDGSGIRFKTPNGKLAVALDDFLLVLEKMSDKDFEKNLKEKNFSTWVKDQLHQEELSAKIEDLSSKTDLVKLVKDELGESSKKEKKSEKKKNSVEFHFDELSAEHKKKMKELADIVQSSKITLLTKTKEKNDFLTQNKALVDSLSSLLHTLELMDEEVFEEALEKDKDSFVAWVADIAKKATSASKLDAKKLQSLLADEIKNESKKIETLLEEKKEEFALASQNIKNQEESLQESVKDLESKQFLLDHSLENFETQKEAYRQEIAKYDEQMAAFNERYQRLIEDIEKKIAGLANREEAFAEHKKKENEIFEEKQKALEKKELDLTVNFKDREALLTQKLAEIDRKKFEINTEFNNREAAIDQKLTELDKKKDAMLALEQEKLAELEKKKANLLVLEREKQDSLALMEQEKKDSLAALEQEKLAELEKLKAESDETIQTRQNALDEKEAQLETRSSELETRKAELESSYQSKLREAESSFQTRSSELESSLQEKERKMESSFQSRQSELESSYQSKLREMESTFQAKVHEIEEKLLSDVKEREASLIAQRIAFEAKKDSFEKKFHSLSENLQRREQTVEESLSKMLDVDKNISQKQKVASRIKEEVDHEGFKSYMSTKLDEIHHDMAAVNKKPVVAERKSVVSAPSASPPQKPSFFERPVTPSPLPKKPVVTKPESSSEHSPVFNIIDKCNEALESGNLENAKQLYSRLKRVYAQEKMSAEEKEHVYDAIREIYSNLHLAKLDQGS